MKTEGNSFKLHNVVEQQPFKEPGVGRFFAHWCKLNDSIVPNIVSRARWEEKEREQDAMGTIVV